MQGTSPLLWIVIVLVGEVDWIAEIAEVERIARGDLQGSGGEAVAAQGDDGHAAGARGHVERGGLGPGAGGVVLDLHVQV